MAERQIEHRKSSGPFRELSRREMTSPSVAESA